jgi:cytochrome c-type biogenesis protein CcmH
MRWLQLFCLIGLMLTTIPHASAVQPDEVLADPALEARARILSKELRCMVCQNQSIDDSDAPLARDLRLLVRERLVAGDTDAQVLDFLVARYGEFVLLKPRLSAHTVLLWLMPALVFLIGVLAIVGTWRRYRRSANSVRETAEAPKLTPAEEARLAELTRGSDS